MPQELIIYVLMGVFGCGLTIFLCVFGLIKIRKAPGGIYYIFSTLMCSIFTFAYTFELTSTTLEQMKFWLKIEYLALPFIPVFILLMCYEHIGKKLSRPLLLLLIVLPIFTVLFNHTNDLHHLYYTSIDMRTDAPFPTLLLEGGPWFYVHSIFLYICIIASMVVLFNEYRKKPFTFRVQILLMVAGLFIPILGGFIYLTGIGPFGLDYGPLSMSISFLFHGAALVSYKMFNVAPIAREIVFESMQDGVLVLDQNGIIIDYNETAHTLLPKLNTFSVGKPVEEILDKNHHLYEIIKNEHGCDVELTIDDQAAHFHIRFSPVNHNGKTVGQIITFVDVTERVFLKEKLEVLASIDGLTQVYNRTFFFKKVAQIYDRLRQLEGKMSFIMFDIDHFKAINDTYGHEAGDLVIQQVIALTKDSLRGTDIIGRYGGEEFVICLPNTACQEAVEVANRIRTMISSNAVFLDGNEIQVTSSFGVSSASLSSDQDVATIKSLVNEADKALYRAKSQGRNYVQAYQKTIA